jgi:hypothetical protein
MALLSLRGCFLLAIHKCVVIVFFRALRCGLLALPPVLYPHSQGPVVGAGCLWGFDSW